MSELLIVGISDAKIVKAPNRVITYALGSCIGICIYDPAIKLAGLLHIMLPTAPGVIDNVFKYADSGLAEFIKRMEALGASRTRMTAKIAGGAQMFAIPGDNYLGNIGKRNADSVKIQMLKQRIPITKSDTGGTYARTVEFDGETGSAKIRTYGKPDLIL